MVSTGSQGLELSDKLLEHLKLEVCDMPVAMPVGMLSGGAVPSAPIHEDILLTLMFELLPYDNSDRSEFSEEGFHNFMSKLNDEIPWVELELSNITPVWTELRANPTYKCMTRRSCHCKISACSPAEQRVYRGEEVLAVCGTSVSLPEVLVEFLELEALLSSSFGF